LQKKCAIGAEFLPASWCSGRTKLPWKSGCQRCAVVHGILKIPGMQVLSQFLRKRSNGGRLQEFVVRPRNLDTARPPAAGRQSGPSVAFVFAIGERHTEQNGTPSIWLDLIRINGQLIDGYNPQHSANYRGKNWQAAPLKFLCMRALKKPRRSPGSLLHAGLSRRTGIC